MSRRRLYTIAPHAPFLPLLADRVLDGTLLGGWDLTTPFGLADVTIILPTRRARLELAQIFAERRGGATLLPDIRTFGGEASEEEPFLPPLDLPVPPPAVTPLERRLRLSQLVKAFAERQDGFTNPPNAAEILWLSDSLGEVIDDLIIEGVPASELQTLVPEDLATNWQDLLKFLTIALEAWPQMLAAEGQIEAATARNMRLARQAETAPLLYGDRPVIAAGSTGSVPATAALLRAIAALPRGAVVLPGLDTTLTPDQHEMLLDAGRSAGHAQYQLGRLLRRLDAGIGEVVELAGEAPRTTLLRHALAAADDTANWPEARQAVPVVEALDGVAMIAAPNIDIEARAIALRARAALVDGRRVGIVTRDQMLGRRIAAELERFSITVDDPAGTPLFQSAAGRLARQALAVVEGEWGVVDVVALLRNGAVTVGRTRAELSSVTAALDRGLRGKGVASGLAGLLEVLTGEQQALIAALGEALAPLPRPDGGLTTAAVLAGALAETLAKLTDGTDYPGRDVFLRWAETVRATAGAPFAPRGLDAVLGALMNGVSVETAFRRRDDIHIWGELEARLMSPDVMILAGLNEDIWPPAADPGPWLSRGMRVGLGLEPPERRQGQAAHDFAMAMGNAEVVLAYAERLGTAPALPSRLVQRLDAFVGKTAADALRARGQQWLVAARALDASGPPRPATRPLPCPPAHLRPRRLSVTEIETLVRSPYDLYARHVLRLLPLEALGHRPEAKERGTLIHDVLAQFVEERSVMAPDAAEELRRRARASLEALGTAPAQREIWLRRFAGTAADFLEWEREREANIAARHAERKATFAFESLGGFQLTGRADRLDLMRDGSYVIIDFKTGNVPTNQEMQAFEAPQLLLEAKLVELGAFKDVPPGRAAELTYVKIGRGPDSFTPVPFKAPRGLTLQQTIDTIWARMQAHVDALIVSGDIPMAARIRPAVNQTFVGPYHHLARTDEWTLGVGE